MVNVNDRIDLSNCDREPIHIPGSIQPHGALLVLESDDLRITQSSDNTLAVLGKHPDELFASGVHSLVPPDHIDGWLKALRSVAPGRPVQLAEAVYDIHGRQFAAIAHRSGASIVLEFEPGEAPNTGLAHQQMQAAVWALSSNNNDLQTLYSLCAHHVRLLTGFDRVMVYRFDANWNGHVVAEDKRDDLEPFLGLHYPASDIPAQARELYTRNWLRFITDRDYVPSRLAPAAGTRPGPLDMSYAVLRSVSPIHLEYLCNMGVRASMSVSLVLDGKLWGLIACHHCGARYVPYDVRSACEFLGQYLSLELPRAEAREMAAYAEKTSDAAKALLDNVARTQDLIRSLLRSTPTVLDLVQADGAAVVVDDQVHRLGQTPSDQDIQELCDFIQQRSPHPAIFADDHLYEQFGKGTLSPVASGVLAVSLAPQRRFYILWFRPEQIRSVDWAGDPVKSVVKGEKGEVRLSPRGSFSLWKEILRGWSAPWRNEDIAAAQRLREALVSTLLARTEELHSPEHELRLTSIEREKLLRSERDARAEAERLNHMKDEFVATLSHELRTPLNAVLGWAQLLARRKDNDEEMIEGLQVIERNARAQNRLVEDLLDISRIIAGKLRLDLQDVHLPVIIDEAIATSRLAADAKGVRLEKLVDPMPGVTASGDPSRLLQVIWNLLSNAIKFTPKGGKVQVILQRINSHVELSVADTGAGITPDFLPYVFDRFKQADASVSRRHGGLGLGLAIVKNLTELHGGSVRADSPGADRGATITVSLPLKAVRESAVNKLQTASDPSADMFAELNMQGIRVLVIDDEFDARELVRRLLVGCGCDVKLSPTSRESLLLLSVQTFDVVISDIGMPGEDGFAFIREMRSLEKEMKRPRTPAIALTAYARASDRQQALIAGYQAHIAKPVEAGELVATVASLAGRI